MMGHHCQGRSFVDLTYYLPYNPDVDDLLIGAHHSIEGGTPRAVERGISTSCRVLQIFVKNNSKRPRGSRVDRHEHIGRGTIGEAGFRNLLADPRLALVPKYLETPKDEALDFDRENLATLRRLAAAGRPE